MDRRGCSACSNPRVQRSQAGGFRLWTCPECGHLTVHPRGDFEAQLIYSHPDYAGFRPDPVFLQSAERELRKASSLAGPPGRLLDIGCGNGMGLQVAEKIGYDAHGIDVSSEAVHLCQSRGLSAELRSVDDPDLGDDWDVATMWDVLEHIEEPRPFLHAVRARLRAGGLLVIKVPTVAAKSATLLVRISPRLGKIALQLPAHLNYFTSDSLERVLRTTGFDVRAMWHVRALRERPSGGSLKRRIARAASRAAIRFCGGTQLIVLAQAV